MTERIHDIPLLTRLARRWFEQRTFRAESFPSIDSLAAIKRAEGLRVSVCLPALDEEETIGAIVASIRDDLMDRRRLVDQLVVVDGGSRDGTAGVARRAGAEVVRLDSLIPQMPAVRGKGESLWRSLTMLTGDVIAWIDADIRNFSHHFVTRLLSPLVTEPDIAFTKAFYRRPLERDGSLEPDGGGRVTELMARPLLTSFFPELGGFLQPLSGEYAGRREVLRKLPFFSGYGVEVGMLIDLLDVTGLDAMAQVDLEERVHRNRPLDELGPMAHTISQTILRRAEEWGRLKAEIDFPSNPMLLPGPDATLDLRVAADVERPPIDLLPVTLDPAGEGVLTAVR